MDDNTNSHFEAAELFDGHKFTGVVIRSYDRRHRLPNHTTGRQVIGLLNNNIITAVVLLPGGHPLKPSLIHFVLIKYSDAVIYSPGIKDRPLSSPGRHKLNSTSQHYQRPQGELMAHCVFLHFSNPITPKVFFLRLLLLQS